MWGLKHCVDAAWERLVSRCEFCDTRLRYTLNVGPVVANMLRNSWPRTFGKSKV